MFFLRNFLFILCSAKAIAFDERGDLSQLDHLRKHSLSRLPLTIRSANEPSLQQAVPFDLFRTVAGPFDSSVSTKKPENDCGLILHAPDQCSYAKTHCTDAEVGVLPYLQIYYCHLSQGKPLVLFVLTLWLAFLFSAIGLAASDYLCLNLSFIANFLGLRENVAGITLLGFGNGSPDLAAAILSFNANSGGLALGELFGAACFITSVVVGIMAIIRPFQVDRRAFVRDVACFAIAVAFSMWFLLDGLLQLWECIVMIVMYASYIAIALLWKDKSPVNIEIQTASRSAGEEASSENPESSIDCDAVSHRAQQEEHQRQSRHGGGSYLDSTISHLNSLPLTAPQMAGTSTTAASGIRPPTGEQQVAKTCEQTTPAVRFWPANQYALREACIQFLHACVPSAKNWRSKSYLQRGIVLVLTPAVLILSATIPITESQSMETTQSLSVNSRVSDVEALESEYAHTARLGHNEQTPLLAQHPSSPLQFDNVTQRPATFDRILLIVRLFLGTCVISGTILLIFDVQTLSRSIIAVLNVSLATLIVMVSCLWKAFRPVEWIALDSVSLSTFGFLASLAWITVIANEVVSVLKLFGIVAGVSDAILGLTIFALGNSVGDLVANAQIARLGYPRMALSACFGGPMLNILVGVGVGGMITIINGPRKRHHHGGKQGEDLRPWHLQVDETLIVSALQLFTALCLVAVIVPYRGWKMDRWVGLLLICLWICGTGINLALQLTAQSLVLG